MRSITRLLTTLLRKTGLLEGDFDYHLLRASMVLIFFFFGYQKWWDYEAQTLIPFISNGQLISWMYPVLGIRGACWFLGVAEWFFGALLFAGFWNKKLGILGALGSVFSFISNDHDYSIYPECLGRVCRRISCDDRNRCFPDEGSRSLGCIRVSAAAGCCESVTVRKRVFSGSCRAAAAQLIAASESPRGLQARMRKSE